MNAPKFKNGARVRDRFAEIEGTVYKTESCLCRDTRYQILRDGTDADGQEWPEFWAFEGRLEEIKS